MIQRLSHATIYVLDHDQALDFYTKQAGLVVAGRFVTEFERVAELLIRHPDFDTPTTRGRRIFPLQVFPYSGIQLCIEALKAAFESWWSGISIGSPALVAVGSDATDPIRPHDRSRVSGDIDMRRDQAR